MACFRKFHWKIWTSFIVDEFVDGKSFNIYLLFMASTELSFASINMIMTYKNVFWDCIP